MCVSSEVSHLYVNTLSKLFNDHMFGFIMFGFITDLVSWFLYSQEDL